MKIDKVRYVENPSTINDVIVENDVLKVIQLLNNGNKVARFEFGDSMMPILQSGEYCILTPFNSDKQEANIGDIVFCIVNGYVMTHMVLLKSRNSKNEKPYYLIGGTNGQLYGWTNEIYAIAEGTRILEKNNLIFQDVE